VDVSRDRCPPAVAAASANCRVRYHHVPVRCPEIAPRARALISPYAGPAAEFASAWRVLAFAAERADMGRFVTPDGIIPSLQTRSGRSHYELAIPLPS